jgi:hypothetical protein
LPEDLSGWSSFHTVRLAKPGGPGALLDVVLPPAVFGTARGDLGDLRLVDGRGHSLPYALRIRRPIDERRQRAARTFDRVTNPDRSVQLSLDLGEAAGEYDQLSVDVQGAVYVRALNADGSNDNKNWSKVLDNAHVVRLREDDKWIEHRRFQFPPTRFRYLRVRLRPDTTLADDAPTLDSVAVFHTVRVPGEDVTHVADLERREPVRLNGEPGSAWIVDLGEAKVPVERLTLHVADADFSRRFQLEAQFDEIFVPVAPREDLLRPTRPGSGRVAIDVAEMAPRRFRLSVVDSGNPPLALQEVRFTAPARQLVFALPAGALGPLRLYSGNPQATAPNYDFASSLPARLDPPPTRLELGDREDNPIYQPPDLPWTERWPYLVDAILAGACAVLLGLVIVLARQAIRRHDATAQPS